MKNGSRQEAAPADARRNVEEKHSAEGGQDAAAWAKVPRRAARMRLTKDALRLLVVLSSHADGASRLAWPSQATLAAELGWVTRSTGAADRRRVSKAMQALSEADLVREAGRQTLGDRAWTNRFLVAPYPKDAEEPYASKDAAPSYASSAKDAYETRSTMRMKRVKDAYPSHAQSDHLDQTRESDKGASRDEDDRAELAAFVVRRNMQSASDEEIRAAWAQEVAHAS
jgi:hypothetical protein